MSERMTREQAVKRVIMALPIETEPRAHRIADLLLAVQTEAEFRITEAWSQQVQALERQVENLKTDCETAEQRVAAKCCEIANRYKTNSAAAISQSIRAAFPAQEDGR